jgi:hypothetical protein
LYLSSSSRGSFDRFSPAMYAMKVYRRRRGVTLHTFLFLALDRGHAPPLLTTSLPPQHTISKFRIKQWSTIYSSCLLLILI